MINSRMIFIIISLSIIVRALFVKNLVEAAAITVSLLVIGSMIWFTDIWTNYFLPFGFWESKATDFKTPGNSSAALIFLAWVLLALFAWGTFVN